MAGTTMPPSLAVQSLISNRQWYHVRTQVRERGPLKNYGAVAGLRVSLRRLKAVQSVESGLTLIR